MFVDTNHWLSKCEQCLVAKGHYTESKTLQGNMVAHQPLELLCINFTKADISKGGKENILVLTDAFSKYSQAFISLTKSHLLLLSCWLRNGSGFLVFPLGSIVIKGNPLTMKLLPTHARCMV